MTAGRWQIPRSWQWVEMQQISEVVGGGTPNASDPSNFDPNGTPWLTPADLSGYQETYISKGSRNLSAKGMADCGAKVMPEGAVLFTSRAPIGYVAIAANPIATNQGFKSFVLSTDCVPEFFRYYLKSSKAYAESMASGSTFLELSGGRTKELMAPLAPKNEQSRIVTKLNALFEKSRSIREKLARLPRLLANVQKSILNSAFRGDLTKEWRANNPNVEPANELLKRIRAERRAKWKADLIAKGKDPKKAKYVEPAPVDAKGLPELPEGWCWTTVGEINICLDSIRVPIKRELRNAAHGLYPYFGANGQVGVIDEYLFDEELVLVTEDETFYGRTKPIAYRVSGKCWVNNHAHVLRAVEPITPDFIWLSLMFYDVIPWLSGTTGRAKLTQGALMSLPIALPPLAEIEAVVSKVKAAFYSLDRLSPAIGEMATRIERSERSILAKAFRGELVPQDPNDEPASALLERIRAQKPVAGTKRGRGKKAAA